MPPLHPQQNPEDEYIRDNEAESLKSEVLQLMVKYRNAAAMWAWCIRCNDLVSLQLLRIYTPHYLRLLEEAKVHMRL